MRKALILSATAALATLGATAHAGVRYVAADDSKESAICVSAAVDRHTIFTNKLEVTGIPFKVAAAKLDCNGVNVALFSAQAGNARTAKELARYSPARGEVEIRQAQNEPSTNPLAATANGDIVILVKGE